jgi:long-subunit fatty acid transport protein
MLVHAGVARANPVDAFGFGARAAAMASAQTAASDDGGANYYNPALLATFDDIRIDLGYQYASPALLVNGLDLGVDPSRGTTASLVAPGRVAGARVALGGGVFLPDQHITRTRTLSSQKPRFVVYDNRPQRLFLAANLSVEITDSLYLGAGLAYMSSTRGDVVLDGRVGFPNAADSDLALGIDVDLETIRYPQLGAYYRVNPWLDVGVSYRGGFKLVLDQVFVVQGDVGAEGFPIVEDGFFRLHTVSQDLFQPAQLTAGFEARLTADVSVAFDLQWQRWSAFENPAARITLALDVGEFNDLVDIPESPPLPVAHFFDIAVPRLGVEWIAMRRPRTELSVRGGYAYEPSPVPEQSGETNFIDSDKHTVSLGAGLVLQKITAILPRPMSVDAFVAATVLESRAHRKISAADPVGDYRSSGHVLQAGISSRWRF